MRLISWLTHFWKRPKRTRIICLANSWKHHGRCIAGIDPATGRWIRPVASDTDDGRIGSRRLIWGREPALLDILEIPLAESGPDFGFQPENRLILRGRWRRVGRAAAKELLPFVDRGPSLLHNPTASVPEAYLKSMPRSRSYTLQLIETRDFRVEHKLSETLQRAQWRASLTATDGRTLRTAITITDPVLTDKLNQGHVPSKHCLVVLGLGLPWSQPDLPTAPRNCWKLVAGVIDLE
jgi:hypothetical protein